MLLLTLFWRGRELSGPSLFLLRGFFPNWRFYHRPGNQPRLYVRVWKCDGNWTRWEVFVPRAHFRLFDLFHNPINNLLHANQNLIDHLNSDIKELRDDRLVEQLVTYQLTARFAYVRATEIMRGAKFMGCQFEIRLISPMTSPPAETKVLISSVIPFDTNAC